MKEERDMLKDYRQEDGNVIMLYEDNEGVTWRVLMNSVTGVKIKVLGKVEPTN